MFIKLDLDNLIVSNLTETPPSQPPALDNCHNGYDGHEYDPRDKGSMPGLLLRQSPAKKKLKVTEVDYHKVFHKALPVRLCQNKKRKYCRRGEA